MTFLSVSTPSISASSWGTMVDSMSELMPVPRVRNSESISSKKTMTGQPSSRLLPGPLEDQADLALGLAHVLVEQLGALDVEEVAAGVLVAGDLAHLLGQGVGHRLGDEGLAAAGGAVEQDALGRRQLVLGEQVPVEEGQLDGVGDRLDLVVEAADVVVGDVGHLLEDQLLDLGPGQLSSSSPERGSMRMVSPARSFGADELVGQLDDPLLVGPAHDDGPPAVLEELLEGDDLAADARCPGPGPR